MKGKIYLIPTPLGEGALDKVLPIGNAEIIRNLKFFVVENERTARRFLKKTDRNIMIEDLQMVVLDEHTQQVSVEQYLKAVENGQDIGLMSEAGCPAIADPGADVVALAQALDIQVVPLVGPSSILMAQMASGFNGQNFAFAGYLPIKPDERAKALKKLETRAKNEHQSQIFIEAPYRNIKMFEDILKTCLPDTKLCVAVDITCETEFIKTKSVKAWKSAKVPDINKRPAIFILF
jgi:16S rRNA (cytidine1402-2'-O)-methyltransferase